jgi:hypothetical protein
VARFLIEVPHPAEKIACIDAVEVLLKTGSHFVTSAEFGCYDGVHSGWIVVDVDSKEEARGIVPAQYRAQASIVGLNKFSLEELEELRRHHK